MHRFLNVELKPIENSIEPVIIRNMLNIPSTGKITHDALLYGYNDRNPIQVYINNSFHLPQEV